MWCLTLYLRDLQEDLHIFTKWSKLKQIKHSPLWNKTCFLAAVLVTFKYFEAGWLLKLQTESFSQENYLKRLTSGSFHHVFSVPLP